MTPSILRLIISTNANLIKQHDTICQVFLSITVIPLIIKYQIKTACVNKTEASGSNPAARIVSPDSTKSTIASANPN